MKRYQLTVAYDGTNYHGWQIQDNGITVEEVLNQTLSKVLSQPVEVMGASRTDAGVHALGNLAVFDGETSIPGDKLHFALNPHLPEDIRIISSREVRADFHPRFVPSYKTYEYHIINGRIMPPTLRKYAAHIPRKLDVDAMRQAGQYLIGRHDFKSFCASKAQVKTTVRQIISLEVEEGKEIFVNEDTFCREIILRVTGAGFLYNMVRIIAGTLIKAGLHVYPPEYVREILEAKDRTKAGETAPAQGLFLKQIECLEHTVSLNCFDIEQICDSGQCFRMEKTGDHQYSVIAGKRFLEIKQEKDQVTFYCTKKEYETFWKNYFDLETNYEEYIEKINPNDQYLKEAAALGSGVRIVKQDLWEMIVSFLISQQNNIIRIRKCIDNICKKYGEPFTDIHGNLHYAFPSPEALAVLEDDDLKECNLGYRSKYVVRAAKAVCEGTINLEEISGMPHKKAQEKLLELFGVGEKVAECICLFGLHHLNAFPVDTHIKQAMEAHYKRGFPHRRYRGIQGVLQQYIFYYELNHNKPGQLTMQ